MKGSKVQLSGRVALCIMSRALVYGISSLSQVSAGDHMSLGLLYMYCRKNLAQTAKNLFMAQP